MKIIRSAWKRGKLGKATVGCGTLLFACIACSVVRLPFAGSQKQVSPTRTEQITVLPAQQFESAPTLEATATRHLAAPSTATTAPLILVAQLTPVAPTATGIANTPQPPPSLATAEPATNQSVSTPSVTVVGQIINVRQGPGINYPVLETLVQGTTVLATGQSADRTWIQIKLPSGDNLGWVSAGLVEIRNPDLLITIVDVPQLAEAVAPVDQAPPQEIPQVQSLVAMPEVAAESSANNSQALPFQCTNGCENPPDPSCAIKGNVNSKGERIYHLPGGSYYERTNIVPAEGDRWFCSTNEAENAGFRPSQR